MSILGGISFFEKNKALFANGTTLAASSNTSDQNLPIGTNKYFTWESIGSDDLTTETLDITLPAATSISRIFLIGHNFKNFQIQYGGSSDFSNVVGLDAYSGSSINVTSFARDAAYFEFDAVSTDEINISIDTTQTVDAQKSINQIIVTNEIGTLTGFPSPSEISFDRNDQTERAVSGRAHIEKGYESVNFGLSLNAYPGQADIDLLESLVDRNESFLTWLCGGKPDQFKHAQKGFRVGDVFQMQTLGAVTVGYYKNLYKSGVNQAYRFQEVVE